MFCFFAEFDKFGDFVQLFTVILYDFTRNRAIFTSVVGLLKYVLYVCNVKFVVVSATPIESVRNHFEHNNKKIVFCSYDKLFPLIKQTIQNSVISNRSISRILSRNFSFCTEFTIFHGIFHGMWVFAECVIRNHGFLDGLIKISTTY